MRNIPLVKALFAKNKPIIVELFYEMNGRHLTCGPFEDGSPEMANAELTIMSNGGRVLAVEALDDQVKARQAMSVTA